MRKCNYAITILYAFFIYGVIYIKMDIFFLKIVRFIIVQKGINEIINSYYYKIKYKIVTISYEIVLDSFVCGTDRNISVLKIFPLCHISQILFP